MRAHQRSYASGSAPGVYRQDVFPPRIWPEFQTGVPAFLGIASPANTGPVALRLWPQFAQNFADTAADGHYLSYAVRGFFENGGQQCYVVPLAAASIDSLGAALDSIADNREIDLVCVPDLGLIPGDWSELQQLIVDHCEDTGDRFAILDAARATPPESASQLWANLDGSNGAIYYPWVHVWKQGGSILAPPCGHIAGVFARTDLARGVYKAPANEVLRGVLALERHVGQSEQDNLNVRGINCIRSFPGRGVRIWGARTLNAHRAWTYVNVRRMFLTLVRWIEWNMPDVVFEPSNTALWARIEREVTTYLLKLFRAGALHGATPEQAFYVKCDEATNSAAADRNTVVTEIGLAPSVPFEFVIVRLAHTPNGITISGPAQPAETLKET